MKIKRKQILIILVKRLEKLIKNFILIQLALLLNPSIKQWTVLSARGAGKNIRILTKNYFPLTHYFMKALLFLWQSTAPPSKP